MRNRLIAMSILTILTTLTVASITTIANADPDTGNNGQCRQVQKLIPPPYQDYAGCHDTFTGPGHSEPSPLP